MRTYLASCLVALVIAGSGVVVLSVIQKNADQAYKTTGVRI